ncbi:hypothetical protein OROMI_025410 [Orobanche minor]
MPSVESGEWRVVRRVVNRNLHAERLPVRQKFNPNHRINPNLQRNAKITGIEVVRWNSAFRAGGSTAKGNFRRITGEADTLTFLFKNFPEECELGTLIHKFEKVGEIWDIFCPNKRDREGKLFGFVRFPMKYDEERVLRDLNEVWIGSYKIRAFIPKFKRNPSPRKASGSLTGARVGYFPVDKGKRKENTSFAGKQKVAEGSGEYKENEKSDLKYQSSEKERECVRNRYTGYLKREFLWEDQKNELLGECGGSMMLRSTGGNLILIQSSTDKTVKRLLEEFDEWCSFWFEWIRPWSEIDVNQYRMVWANWIGVPIHVWSEKFFAGACANFGLFNKMDVETENRSSLESSRILVSTSCFNTIDRVIHIRIDGKMFPVRIMEETICSCKLQEVEQGQVIGDSVSCWSDELEGSVGPVVAFRDEGDEMSKLSDASPAGSRRGISFAVEQPFAIMGGDNINDDSGNSISYGKSLKQAQNYVYPRKLVVASISGNGHLGDREKNLNGETYSEKQLLYGGGPKDVSNNSAGDGQIGPESVGEHGYYKKGEPDRGGPPSESPNLLNLGGGQDELGPIIQGGPSEGDAVLVTETVLSPKTLREELGHEKQSGDSAPQISRAPPNEDDQVFTILQENSIGGDKYPESIRRAEHRNPETRSQVKERE